MVAAAVVALAPHPDVAASDWIPLGGPYDDSTPQVSPTGNFVMQTGLDNGSYAHLRTGGFWSGPLDLGGQFQSVATPTVELNGPQPSPAEWFGIGLDSAMWHRTQNTGWQSLGGLFIDSPEAIRFGGVTYVFGIGWDEAVWYRTLASGWVSLGGQITSSLEITIDGTNMYLIGLGVDDAMWVRRFSGSAWSG